MMGESMVKVSVFQVQRSIPYEPDEILEWCSSLEIAQEYVAGIIGSEYDPARFKRIERKGFPEVWEYHTGKYAEIEVVVVELSLPRQALEKAMIGSGARAEDAE